VPGVWDRLLAFLGFEEEAEEGEEPATAAVPLAAVQGGAYRASDAVASHRRPRGLRAEDRSEVRATGAPRGATVTRLVAGVPGVVVSAPKRFEDAQEAADHLRAGKPVILHVEGMDRELTQRLVNFLAGSTYALGGEMHRIGSVVLFAPAGVEVTLPISLRLAEREGH
jgi:cell division inhibitor SepF